MSWQAIFDDFKKELLNAICFKTFEINKFIINVCCLKEDINLKKEIAKLSFLMLKHGTNRVYNEITSLKKFCNSMYKFVFSKKTFS